ncbi:hypothetical protein V2J09_007675 [Rumex salicifolius]
MSSHAPDATFPPRVDAIRLASPSAPSSTPPASSAPSLAPPISDDRGSSAILDTVRHGARNYFQLLLSFNILATKTAECVQIITPKIVWENYGNFVKQAKTQPFNCAKLSLWQLRNPFTQCFDQSPITSSKKAVVSTHFIRVILIPTLPPGRVLPSRTRTLKPNDSSCLATANPASPAPTTLLKYYKGSPFDSWAPVKPRRRLKEIIHNNKSCNFKHLFALFALFATAADIAAEVSSEERIPGKKRKRAVEDWMKNAEEIKSRIDCIEGEVEESSSSLFGFQNNRARLRNEILKITKEMEELLGKGGFQNGLTIPDLASSSLPLVTTETKGQHFEENMREILSWLSADEAQNIGVYGLRGVGITTLAMHIHNQLLHGLGKTASVYWVTVSQDCTVSMLQEKIAKELGLSRVLGDVDMMKRPAILSEALKKRSNVVVILDDMWDCLPVEKVGLPIGKNGCKLLLTTRSQKVCAEMGCQKILRVQILSEEESWSLFADRLGNCDDLSTDAREIAKLVVKECGGLPLGIIVVAACMRGVFDVYEWKNALAELRNYKWERDEVVRFWIMEGHLEEIQSWQEQLNRAHTMLNRLISACLLDAITESTRSFVKMHDLIRDMAIKISRERHHSMIKAGMQLREVPCLQEWTEKMSKVSLVSNKITEIPPGMSPSCPVLSTLLLHDNTLTTIPDSFFRFLNGLRFLDLSWTRIERLLDCISHMENLSTLNVSSCKELIFIPSLEKLAKLRHLNMNGCSKIDVLPKGMEKLVNLNCLSMNLCENLRVLFSELTSDLSNIQCLELGSRVTDAQMGDLQRLGCLERLTGCLILDTTDFNSYVESDHFHRLTSYQLLLGSNYDSYVSPHDRSIIINSWKFESGAEAQPAKLPHNIQELYVQYCEFHVRSLAEALPSLNGLTRLTLISMYQCQGLESIWSESSCAKPKLESLETLLISNSDSFRALAKGRLELSSSESLSSLKKLEIFYCSKAEKIFTPWLLKGQLRNLEYITIFNCERLEELFAGSDLVGDGDANFKSKDAIVEVNQDMIMELPKLRVLTLQRLPRLVSICKIGLVRCKSIEEIKVSNCPRLKKLPLLLDVQGNGMPLAPPCLKEINVDWWESLLWDNPDIKSTLQPFVKFCWFSEFKIFTFRIRVAVMDAHNIAVEA